nr:asparagine synthase (glutamine-hydrolyzing) [Methylosinus sp. Sm6]
MCGIAGCLFAGPAQRGLSIVAAMSERLSSRGPDESGAWGDEQGRAFLGHRRLSIIDVSANGRQPMRSIGGRYVVAFNGEIYNHLEMRAELEEAGAYAPWRGHSDTETLLAAFERWGVEPTLDRAVGMFAIALWDTTARTLHIARDLFGEKPLYYGWVGRDFVFGSELKALRAFPGFSNPVCHKALALYMRFLYVRIYSGVYKLEPECDLSIDTSAGTISGDPLRPSTARRGLTLRRWWSLGATVEAGARQLFDNEDEAVRALEDRLREAIQFQSLADVPVGAFLSGGVDSSTIVALMQRQSARRVRTFTVGFEDAGFDEAPHARAVARHLGTEHAELFVTAAEARAIIPRLPAIYDEPFADSSRIPTHSVCRAAREQVAVALSGDADDELFGGYHRYFWAPRIWRRLAWLPYPARSALAASLAAAPMAG